MNKETKETIDKFLFDNKICREDVCNCQEELKTLKASEIVFTEWQHITFLTIGIDRVAADKVLSKSSVRVIKAMAARTDRDSSSEITKVAINQNGELITKFVSAELSKYKSLCDFFLTQREYKEKRPEILPRYQMNCMY